MVCGLEERTEGNRNKKVEKKNPQNALTESDGANGI